MIGNTVVGTILLGIIVVLSIFLHIHTSKLVSEYDNLSLVLNWYIKKFGGHTFMVDGKTFSTTPTNEDINEK